MSTARLIALSLLLALNLRASGRVLASESVQRLAWISRPASGKLSASVETVSSVLFSALSQDNLLAADESIDDLSSESKSQSGESRLSNEKTAASSPSNPHPVENKSGAASPSSPMQPAASEISNPSIAKAPQRNPVVRSPSILQMLDGHELELLVAVAIALSFFLIGWICGGNYYLRRDRHRRTKLRF